MREILFRGKRTDNGEWVEGYYCRAFRWAGDKEPVPAIQENDSFMFRAIDPSTIGQYTGLTANGKKIFEGDILKQETTTEFAKYNSYKWECYGIVKFGYYDWDAGEAGKESIGWYIKPLKSVPIYPKKYLVGNIQAGLTQSDINNKLYPMAVIGNIHDNPELLKGESDNGSER